MSQPVEPTKQEPAASTEQQTEKPTQGKKQKREKTHVPFSQMLSTVDERGDYSDPGPFEYKKRFNLTHLSKDEKVFLKNQAMALMRFGGLSPFEVSEVLGLPVSSVETWRSKATADMTVEITNSERLLVGKRLNQALNTSLGAVERVARYVSEREYIQAQDPEKVTKLFETVTNFSLKLIEAQQRAEVARRQMQLDADYTTKQPTGEQPATEPTVN